ncbi:exodeoxyribonuclease VII large subunit [Streptococcus anginosus]|uniref:Exodeoxyribonuclease 7 large subunit n=1 Tax=Streptococcus anginosus subsp. whileyi CCUG 39159 TaxID=1095729 RepID=I0SDZ9_STRAP|nr:exodeoxyribonuclease VII large subunit [Streptococcus anginosus]AGU83962.1 exodeoxyribonuclease VII large subunit [Streptococcus anginosus C238]EID21602.1 exodeoxyribonuclease VII, large subunit [Streptococcus anginosus subsp. whileyi CCUG 39159]MDB8661865.1 exodeoxyribonuclease VII large subunit [Streptococcus anginosus]MDP1385138.1 exodeoxyribonuclease VII large subunit [Streptococcus anginosus]QQT08261.1 exodeoxyribonuclease VII large subunit [Streptococcus anginosus]
MTEYLPVSTLTKYLKLKFDKDPYLERVYLTGQVSNFRRRPNHQYFSLKDEKAVIQATIWGGVYKKLGFDLEEGMKINVIGRVQLYEPSGSYSIIIEKAEPDGIGALAIQFEQLKKKLGEEGLFEERFKQALPQFPKKIGVVTSPSGAVIRDIITTVSRRFPGVEIILYPTKVQGEGASAEVAENIRRANERNDLDVLIIGRGGGSIEDLWAFNEEVVVRAIFESHIPIISSVGHETDTTLADFVADRRAATPTAAAELATPVTKLDLLAHLQQQQNRLAAAMSNRLTYNRERLAKLSQSVIFRQPERLYDSYLQKLDQLNLRLKQKIREYYNEKVQRARLLQHRLEALAPLRQVQIYQERVAQLERLLRSNMAVVYDHKVAEVKRLSDALLMLDTSRIVARGYAIVKKDEQVLESIEKVNKKDQLTILMRDGQIEVEVKDVERKEI